MKSIDQEQITTYQIKKSIFITILSFLEKEEDQKEIMKQIKKKYPGANHYCYAYIIDHIKRCSDDAEPNKTAGMPILNVLEMNNLDHISCIVVRYFGGIKLGAGGLVRAYTKAVATALTQGKIITKKEGIILSLNFPYDRQKQILTILKDFEIINQSFTEQINVHIAVENSEWAKLEPILTREDIAYQQLGTIYLKETRKS